MACRYRLRKCVLPREEAWLTSQNWLRQPGEARLDSEGTCTTLGFPGRVPAKLDPLGNASRGSRICGSQRPRGHNGSQLGRVADSIATRLGPSLMYLRKPCEAPLQASAHPTQVTWRQQPSRIQERLGGPDCPGSFDVPADPSEIGQQLTELRRCLHVDRVLPGFGEHVAEV